MPEPEVLLVGGTSHVGKSTLAERLASDLGWATRSTDHLARHPGRPWKEHGSALPGDVERYYASAPGADLVESVVAHYRDNVWPIAAALVRSHVNNPYDPKLVLEGSALLPELFAAAGFERCEAVWLTASEGTIRARVRESSGFAERDAASRSLIEVFTDRAIAFQRRIIEATGSLGLPCIDIEAEDPLPRSSELARGEAQR